MQCVTTLLAADSMGRSKASEPYITSFITGAILLYPRGRQRGYVRLPYSVTVKLRAYGDYHPLYVWCRLNGYPLPLKHNCVGEVLGLRWVEWKPE